MSEQRVKELLKKNHIGRPPVDVGRIAATEGLEIRYSPTGTNISGALVRSDHMTFIAVNNAHHLNRQRFTIAHELAHFFLDHEGTDLHIDGDFTINLRYRSASEAADRSEIQANQFAAELLMPREFLVRDALTAYPL